jgi:hypothetical protein
LCDDSDKAWQDAKQGDGMQDQGSKPFRFILWTCGIIGGGGMIVMGETLISPPTATILPLRGDGTAIGVVATFDPDPEPEVVSIGSTAGDESLRNGKLGRPRFVVPAGSFVAGPS